MDSDPMLRFSQDKYIGRYSLSEFKKMARRVEQVLTASQQYKMKRAIYLDSGPSERELPSLDDLDKNTWDFSARVRVVWKPEGRPNSVQFTSLDYFAPESNRLFFYGQDLDPTSYGALVKVFCRRGFSYRIGDGFNRSVKPLRNR